VELTDRIIDSCGLARRGPGKPPEVTDAALVCLAVAQVLLRFDDERHWLRAAPELAGHLFPRLLRQSGYNDRLKAAAPLMEAALRWLAGATPGSAEMVRLMDATPVPCGQSAVTAKRSDLYGWAGYGYCPSHSRWYWGAKLLLICTCDGTVTGFGLANPKLFGEREDGRAAGWAGIFQSRYHSPSVVCRRRRGCRFPRESSSRGDGLSWRSPETCGVALRGRRGPKGDKP
jgi:hypothetical protein